jgi:UDP-glucose 4-epimerase
VRPCCGFRFNPIYASDAAAAIGAASSLESSETINVAGTDVVSLREVATTIGDLLGRVPRFESHLDSPAKHLIGCTGKMKRLLVEPMVPIRLGLQRMIGSHRAVKKAAAGYAM